MFVFIYHKMTTKYDRKKFKNFILSTVVLSAALLDSCQTNQRTLTPVPHRSTITSKLLTILADQTKQLSMLKSQIRDKQESDHIPPSHCYT
jgi:hypothetical protein